MPSPPAVSAGPVAAHEAPEDLFAQPVGDPGPSSATSSDRVVFRCAACRDSIGVPSGVWRTAFSSRLRTSRWSSSGLPSDGDRSAASTDVVAVGERVDLLDGRLRRSSPRSTSARVAARARHRRARAAADRRPAGASAGRSAAPSRRSRRPVLAAVVERCLEQLEVGEDAGQRRAQLVRGVGDELALPRIALLGLRSRGVELPKHAVQRPGELGDLVVARRARHSLRGVAGRGDVARGARSARRSAASPGRRRPARRAARAACRRATPTPRKSQSVDRRHRRRRRGCAYWTKSGAPSAAVGDQLRRDARGRRRSDPRSGRAEVGGVRGLADAGVPVARRRPGCSRRWPIATCRGAGSSITGCRCSGRRATARLGRQGPGGAPRARRRSRLDPVGDELPDHHGEDDQDDAGSAPPR